MKQKEIAPVIKRTTPEMAAFAAKLDGLSNTAIIVLDALCKEVHRSTRGDFGFMECAYKDHLKTKISKHEFAGYVSALSDFIEWSFDLSKERDIIPQLEGVQFMVTVETYEKRDLIEKRADALRN
tara:strand:+ start:120 stop:494 length:375 start_codon:yes stop_codon:yes gene_type:complete